MKIPGIGDLPPAWVSIGDEGQWVAFPLREIVRLSHDPGIMRVHLRDGTAVAVNEKVAAIVLRGLKELR